MRRRHQPWGADADHLKTTITEDNDASWALFRSFARSIGGELTDEPHFESEEHFGGQHDTEHMVTIRFTEDASDELRGNWISLRDADEARSDDAA